MKMLNTAIYECNLNNISMLYFRPYVDLFEMHMTSLSKHSLLDISQFFFRGQNQNINKYSYCQQHTCSSEVLLVTAGGGMLSARAMFMVVDKVGTLAMAMIAR